jgi:hypothetical protein
VQRELITHCTPGVRIFSPSAGSSRQPPVRQLEHAWPTLATATPFAKPQGRATLLQATIAREIANAPDFATIPLLVIAYR